VARPRAHTELDGSVPSEWDHQDTKGGHDDTHGNVRHVLWVHLPALELIAAIIPRQQAGKPDEHLPERRVHVEVKLALEVVRAKLAKVRLVPNHVRRLADLVISGPARQESVHGRCDML
jgi:hypothetical protein